MNGKDQVIIQKDYMKKRNDSIPHMAQIKEDFDLGTPKDIGLSQANSLMGR